MITYLMSIKLIINGQSCTQKNKKYFNFFFRILTLRNQIDFYAKSKFFDM